jgi:hypothetical protein
MIIEEKDLIIDNAKQERDLLNDNLISITARFN